MPFLTLFAPVPDSPWKTPGTITSVSRTGGSVSWVNPGNAASSDDTYATASLVLNGSHWLWCENFGFTEDDIPAEATIVGVEARWEAKQTNPGLAVEGPTTTYVNLIKGSALTGTEKTSSGHLTGTDAVYSFGGEADMWSATFTAAEAIASTTGVAFAFSELDYETTTVSADLVELRFYYSIPATGRRRCGFF